MDSDDAEDSCEGVSGHDWGSEEGWEGGLFKAERIPVLNSSIVHSRLS